MRPRTWSLAPWLSAATLAVTHAQIPTLDVPWTALPIGGGGQVRDIAIHPTDSDVVYGASDTGGIYKSIDAGVSWTLMNDGMASSVPDLQVLTSGAIVIDPSRPDTLYTCIGNVKRQGWLFKSVDGAGSWQLLTDQFLFDAASSFPQGQRAPRRCVTLDPNDPDTLYVSTYGDGLYRSEDGGASFSYVGLRDVWIASVGIHPQDPNRLIVGVWSDGVVAGGAFVSANRGATWTRILNGLDVKQVTLAPGRPQDMYATTYWQGVAKSSNGGLSWAPSNGTGAGTLPTGAGEPIYSPDRPELIPRELVYGDVEVDPSDPNVVWVTARGNGTVYRSADGGASWANVGDPSMVAPLAIAIDPRDGQSVYVSDAFGVYHTRDGGQSWTLGVSGLENTVVETVAFDPDVPGTFWVGLYDLTILSTTDGGQTFTQLESIYSVAPPFRINVGFSIEVDASSDPRVLHVGSGLWQASKNGGGIYKSLDGGASWSTAHDGLPAHRVRELAMDPSDPRYLYAAVEGAGVSRSSNGGLSWQELRNGLHFPEALFASGFRWHPEIVVDPNDGRNVWFIADARATGGSVDRVGTVYRSPDRGNRWFPANLGLPEETPSTLTIDGAIPGRLWMGTLNQGVYVSDDGARSWQAIGPEPFEVRSIAVDPNDPTRVVVGGVGRVLLTEDRGASWTELLGPPARYLLRSVAIDPHDPGALYVATGGQGLFRVQLP